MKHIYNKQFLVIVLFLLAHISCKKEELKPDEIVSIDLKTAPVKTIYSYGDIIDFSGLVITQTKRSGITEDIGFSEFDKYGITSSPEKGTEITQSRDIIIKYANKDENLSLTFWVKVLVMDIEGNIYKTVKIGEQVWMGENLKTAKYSNGDIIPTTIPAVLNVSTENSPKYQWPYDGNVQNAADYGRLYTWYAVTDARGICPAGWHTPTNNEWKTLIDYLGGDDLAGGKLKEFGLWHWASPNVGAGNESDFAARPGGERDIDGFYSMKKTGVWWTATEEITGTEARYQYVGYDFDGTYGGIYSKSYGCSVRCVKD